MKYCLVEIDKDRTGVGTKFTYPDTYDETRHTIVYYENKGASTEHAVSKVPDDFDFTRSGFTELTKAEAEAKIDDFVGNDKDMGLPPLDEMPDAVTISPGSEPGNPSTETLNDYKTYIADRRKAAL